VPHQKCKYLQKPYLMVLDCLAVTRSNQAEPSVLILLRDIFDTPCHKRVTGIRQRGVVGRFHVLRNVTSLHFWLFMIKLFVCDLSHCLSLWVELGQGGLADCAFGFVCHVESGGCGGYGSGLIAFGLGRDG